MAKGPVSRKMLFGFAEIFNLEMLAFWNSNLSENDLIRTRYGFTKCFKTRERTIETIHCFWWGPEQCLLFLFVLNLVKTNLKHLGDIWKVQITTKLNKTLKWMPPWLPRLTKIFKRSFEKERCFLYLLYVCMYFILSYQQIN